MSDHDPLSLNRLTGIGSQTLVRLARLGLFNQQDLLFHLPARYEDRTHIDPIGSLTPGQHVQVEARIELTELTPRGRRCLICRISDGTGHLFLRFFHFTARQIDQLARGLTIRCYGEVKAGFYGLEMAHPDYRLISAGESGQADSQLTPVYPLTDGLHQKTLRNLLAQVLQFLKSW